MLKVLYYYYYLFYSKVLIQPESHFVTILVLSAMESFLINYLIDFLSVHLFCAIPSEIWYKLLVVGTLLIINFIYYEQNGKGKVIVKEKPKFFNDHRLSIVIVLVITLFIISLLFWAADYKMAVLNKCK